MELIKYLIKKYPLLSLIFTHVCFDAMSMYILVLLYMSALSAFLTIIYPNENSTIYTIIYFIPVVMSVLYCFISIIPVPVLNNYILNNVRSGTAYTFLSKLRHSVLMKCLLIFVLIKCFFFAISVFLESYFFVSIIISYIILFLYWYLYDVWKKSDETFPQNIFQKIIYYTINFIIIMCDFFVFIQLLIKNQLKKLLFLKKYIAAVISKTQLLCFILVNVLCSGYVFIKLLDFCWFKIVKVYFMDIYGLFYMLFIILWGIQQIGRFFILPNIYNFIIDNVNSGIIKTFLQKLKNDNRLKFYTLFLVVLIDMIGFYNFNHFVFVPEAFIHNNSLLFYLENTNCDGFLARDLYTFVVQAKTLIYALIYVLFISITPIYLILYLYWHVEKQNRLEKTEKFSH